MDSYEISAILPKEILDVYITEPSNNIILQFYSCKPTKVDGFFPLSQYNPTTSPPPVVPRISVEDTRAIPRNKRKPFPQLEIGYETIRGGSLGVNIRAATVTGSNEVYDKLTLNMSV